MEFQEFPAEILLHIVRFLSVKDMNNFGETCSLHYAVVRENDETLRGRCNLTDKDTGELCVYNMTPSGNGSVMVFFEGNVTVTSLRNGVRNGFEMSVFEGGGVNSGTHKNGKRIGIWKNDSAGFRDDWNGSSCRMKYDENGLIYSHSKIEEGETIIAYTDNKNVEFHYMDGSLEDEFYCESTGGNYCRSFIKYIHNTREGTYKKSSGHLFYCCKEHQGDMPDDLLYAEETGGFIERD